MSYPWLFLVFSCFAPASPQYIDSGTVAADAPLDLTDSAYQYPLPYTHYFNLPPNFEPFQRDSPLGGDYQQSDPARKRRTVEEAKNWLPNLVDTDKTIYLKGDEAPPSVIIGYHDDDNKTEVEKKNFSPWGGKRDRPLASFEHMWSWKRSSNIREPSMPKRVRFSPWGGKRSGQMIYKPGAKAPKIIFFSSVPELRRIVSNYSPSGKQLNLASFQFIPGIDKRHPIKIPAMSSAEGSGADRTLREALPFNTLMEPTSQLFKPGHPYNEVHLKKDGKRKMKFSIWGGKRAPPIIGPIWTPASADLQDSTLHSILMLRNKMKNDALNSL